MILATNDLKRPPAILTSVLTLASKLLHRELAIQNMSPINILKDSQTSSQAALSDLRPASDLRENYTLFLNEFQDSQTVKFDFGHKIGAIDL